MEAKAIKFVKIIRRKLKSEPEFEGVPLEKLFLRSFETLPDGEFKAELLGNLARYRKLLTHKKNVLRPASGYPEINATNTPSSASVETQKQPQSRKPNVSSGSTKRVKHAEFSGPAELRWMVDLRRTVTLTCVYSVTNDVLQRMMKLYTSKLTEHLTEDLLCGLKQNGLMIVGQELKRFLHFCNHGYIASEEFQRPPTYHDLIAALLSIYVDVTLLSTRQKDVEAHRRESKQLLNTVVYLLRRSPGHVLDVLLQQTHATPSDSVTLLPLYMKALKTVSVTHEPGLYTTYMLMAHQALQLFIQERSTLREMALQVAAPAGYFEWLRDQNVCVPEIEYMRGAAVSKVLLQECDADTLGLLMDMLTDDTRMDDSSSCVISGAPESADDSRNTDKCEAAMTPSEQPLFFMDKVASKLPIDLKPVDIDVERVVENDACVGSGNQHDADETESLLAISSVSDDLLGADEPVSGADEPVSGADEPVSGKVDQDWDKVAEFISRDVTEVQLIDISSGADTDSDVELHPNKPDPLAWVEEHISGGTKRPRVTAKRDGNPDDEMSVNTPSHRIRTYTRRSMSLKNSSKKSAIAKTPGHIDTEEEVDFTGLRSRGTPLRSPPKPSRTAGIVAPSAGGDDRRGTGVASGAMQDESDDGSIVIVTPQSTRTRSCRLLTPSTRLRVDESVPQLHKKKVELRPAVTGKSEGDVITVKTYIATPKSRRQSGVQSALSAVKSQKADHSKRSTPKRSNADVGNSDLTRLRSSELDPASLSSPVLTPGGGKRSKKKKSNVIADDLDGSWVVIDTPIRNTGHKSEDAVSPRVNTPVLTPRGLKRESCKSTPLRSSSALPPHMLGSPRKRKSLVKGETPKQDDSKSDIESTHWLRQRRKSTLT